ncbi:MAG: hypothetical protein AAB972_04310 [Patescibacteria group bacterium]
MSTILKKFSTEDHDHLHAMCKGIFLDGECYAFALALHRNIGWPLIGLMQGLIIRHAAVQSQQNFYYDARGVITKESFGSPFFLKPPYELRIITEADLYAVRPIQERSIDLAWRMAQALWPELPWKVTTHAKEVLAFMDDLEKISRAHNVWIRSPFPGCPPVLSRGDGSENGYVVSPTSDGMAYVFDRYLTNVRQ